MIKRFAVLGFLCVFAAVFGVCGASFGAGAPPIVVKSKSGSSGKFDYANDVARENVELSCEALKDLRIGDEAVWEVDGRSIVVRTVDVEAVPDGQGFVWIGKSVSEGLPFILSVYDGRV